MALLDDGDARRTLAIDATAAPALVDAEVANALRSLVLRGLLPEPAARAALRTWSHLGVVRFPIRGLLDRMWDLRNNLTAYDATYVALAETLGVALHTADARLASAPGVRCPITVVTN